VYPVCTTHQRHIVHSIRALSGSGQRPVNCLYSLRTFTSTYMYSERSTIKCYIREKAHIVFVLYLDSALCTCSCVNIWRVRRRFVRCCVKHRMKEVSEGGGIVQKWNRGWFGEATRDTGDQVTWWTQGTLHCYGACSPATSKHGNNPRQPGALATTSHEPLNSMQVCRPRWVRCMGCVSITGPCLRGACLAAAGRAAVVLCGALATGP